MHPIDNVKDPLLTFRRRTRYKMEISAHGLFEEMNSPDQDIITKSRLVHDLMRLGVERGDTLMLHTSIKRIGWIVGGPNVVIDALLDVLGDTGTLMMYVAWEEGPYTMEGWSEARRQAYYRECPPFDPATSRAYRAWSILTEYLRTRPGARRSANPECSMAAVGAKAEWLTADHPMNYGLGKNSPLDRLCRLDGKVALLGCPFTELTLLHYAEHLAEIPDKPIVRYRQPILQAGETVWVEVEELDSNKSMGRWERDEDCFEALVKDYLATGQGRFAHVGAADCHLFEARKLVHFAVEWLEEEFG